MRRLKHFLDPDAASDQSHCIGIESKVIFVLGLQFVKNHSCKYLKEADLQIILSESLSPFQTFSYCYLLLILFLYLLILYSIYL